MGIYKKFGESPPPPEPPVVLGRRHKTDPVHTPGRVAAAYGSAGVAAGAPEILDFDVQIRCGCVLPTEISRSVRCRSRVVG